MEPEQTKDILGLNRDGVTQDGVRGSGERFCELEWDGKELG